MPNLRAYAIIFLKFIFVVSTSGASTAFPSPVASAKRLGSSPSSDVSSSSSPVVIPMLEMLVVSRPETFSTSMFDEVASPKMLLPSIWSVGSSSFGSAFTGAGATGVGIPTGLTDGIDVVERFALGGSGAAAGAAAGSGAGWAAAFFASKFFTNARTFSYIGCGKTPARTSTWPISIWSVISSQCAFT